MQLTSVCSKLVVLIATSVAYPTDISSFIDTENNKVEPRKSDDGCSTRPWIGTYDPSNTNCEGPPREETTHDRPKLRFDSLASTKCERIRREPFRNVMVSWGTCQSQVDHIDIFSDENCLDPFKTIGDGKEKSLSFPEVKECQLGMSTNGQTWGNFKAYNWMTDQEKVKEEKKKKDRDADKKKDLAEKAAKAAKKQQKIDEKRRKKEEEKAKKEAKKKSH